MKSIRYAAAACVALSVTLPAAAQVTVNDPWIRGTVPQQMSTGAFMQLKSATDAKLIEARSSVAGVVEIHDMTMVNNVMRMRAVPSVALPAGRTVELKPGGYHVMMMDLKQQMKDGDVVPLTLVVESGGKRETIEVKAKVRAATASGDMTKKPGN
jgi:copper(I)-binding protein